MLSVVGLLPPREIIFKSTSSRAISDSPSETHSFGRGAVHIPRDVNEKGRMARNGSRDIKRYKL